MAVPARRVLRAFWFLLVVAVLIAFPAIIWKFSSTGYSVQYQAWFYGGIFVVLTLPVSLYEVAMHLVYYTKPDLQKFVIRISWMVPVYSLDAWLSLRFLYAHIYLDPLRECYEAFVIYSFYQYLVFYLTSKVGNLEDHVEKKPQIEHIWGFQFICRKWAMGKEYIWQCKKGILNYVVLRPILAVIGMLGETWNFYKVGKMTGVWIWICVINNISQIWAIYCLLMFYRATKEDLSPIRPVSKFLLIKAIVFLTYWQAVAISIFFSFNIVKSEKWTTYDTQDVSAGIQDFFVCVEMFFAALLFAYAFPPKDYIDELEPGDGFLKNVVDMFDVRDVVGDVSSHFEDGMSRSTKKVVNVTNEVVHQVGKILSSPATITKKWKKDHAHNESEAPEDASQSLLWSSNASSSSRVHELSTSIASEMAMPESHRSRVKRHRQPRESDSLLKEESDYESDQVTTMEPLKMETMAKFDLE